MKNLIKTQRPAIQKHPSTSSNQYLSTLCGGDSEFHQGSMESEYSGLALTWKGHLLENALQFTHHFIYRTLIPSARPTFKLSVRRPD
ncbi:hypothetical protein AVEN_139249-1 [Araneus ventricosus]|uniref:Uncharacterized protein n=1 Tax=Araneus ventricosus TaxID=182803 RepID=A0A4Y2MAX9_ARAVE|nr:hypothetical protein AVEN_139249-1 [Araneus ventricosus]